MTTKSDSNPPVAPNPSRIVPHEGSFPETLSLGSFVRGFTENSPSSGTIRDGFDAPCK